MDSQDNNKQSSPPPSFPINRTNHLFLNDFFFGLSSGLIGKGIFYPFENARKLVAQRANFKPFQRTEVYFVEIPRLFKEGGLSIFFKGFVPATLKYGIQFGSNLAVFFELKKTLFPNANMGRSRKDLALKENILCGLLSSLISYAFLSPLFESKAPKREGFIKENSLRYIYRYWKCDVPRVMIASGVLIGLYEAKLQRQYNWMKGRKLPLFVKFFDAYSLALFTGFLAYPFEKRKEKLMENVKRQAAKPEETLNINRTGFRPLLKGISSIFVTQIQTAFALTLFYTMIEEEQARGHSY